MVGRGENKEMWLTWRNVAGLYPRTRQIAHTSFTITSDEPDVDE